MKKNLCVSVISALMMNGMTYAATVTWLGANRTELSTYADANWKDGIGDWLPGFDPTAFFDAGQATVDTSGYDAAWPYYLWSNSGFPGPGDTAYFGWNSSMAPLTGTVSIVGASFNPDHISFSSTRDYRHRHLLLLRDLSIETLIVNLGSGTATVWDELLFLVGEIATPATLTMTGLRPLSFAGRSGIWGLFNISAGSTVAFAGNNHIFDEFNPVATSYRGAVGAGRFTFNNPASTIELGLPIAMTAPAPSIGIGAPDLWIHKDQTWLNPSGAGYIHVDRQTDGRIVAQSIDAGRLDNLGAVPFLVNFGPVEFGGGTRVYLQPGTYQGLHLAGSYHACCRSGFFKLNGDVTLAGGAVIPATSTEAALESDYGVMFASLNMLGIRLDISGYTLTLARGIEMRKAAGDRASFFGAIFIIADDATLDIGGNLVLDEATWPAGTTNGVGALEEARRIGVSGNAATVVNLRGSFISNTRSATGYNNLYRSTVNLLEGTPAAPNTFEVCADPGQGIVDDTYAIGTVNIGTLTEEGHVMLVNDYVNDNDAANPNKVKDGEVLLADNLTIGPNSTLDCSGEGVKVVTSLSIDATGTLNLNTGLTLKDVYTITNFFGVGDQTGVWSASKKRVIDSSNDAFSFIPVYVVPDNRTYWQAIPPHSGTFIFSF